MFLPRIDGTASVRADRQPFLAAFARRVQTGLLSGASGRRSQYAVVEEGTGRIRVRATTWLTAFNVGLNDVELTMAPDGRVHYLVTYWRWAAYALVLGGAIGVTLIAIFLALDIREYIARHPSSQLPGWSIDQNAALAWGMALFWGFVWPWLLIALHKRPLHRLIQKIIADVDAGVPH